MTLPADFRLTLDARLDGDVLWGGEPFARVSLSPAQAAAVRAWRDGAPVGGHGALARALVAANLAQPVPPPGRAPVSVVIPVRDGPVRVPEADEVIVVDDASREPVRAPGARVIRRARRGGPGAARNDGLAAARHDLVAFLDADCVPEPGWLDALVPHFADPLVAAVAPRVVARGRGAWARYEALRAPFDRGPLPARVIPGGRVPFVPGAALVTRREGFDAALRRGEDVDLVWRLHAQGRHVRYEPAARVVHAPATLRRRIDYGRGAALLARRHPGAARPLGVSPWTLAAWVAAGLGRPLTGAAITAVATGLLAREIGAPGEAARLAGLGTLRSGRVVADALTRAYWPAGLAAAAALPRLRAPLAAAALVPPLLEPRALDPLRWTALRLADDAAYGLGLWLGCAEQRTLDPLTPALGWRLQQLSGDALLACTA